MTGSAVYIYTIISFGNTELSFYIDGATVGRFSRKATVDAPFRYNQLVYYNASLDLRWHNLTIAMRNTTQTKDAEIWLDYVVYT